MPVSPSTIPNPTPPVSLISDMKIIKKSGVPIESAHGGQGSRQLFLTEGEIENKQFQAFTKGYLPSGGKFSWHSHKGIEEMMLVFKGQGVVRDREGEYRYEEGDFFVFPAHVVHEIENTSSTESEYIFVRVKVS